MLKRATEAFWRLPLQSKLLLPILPLVCVAAAAVGTYDVRSVGARTESAARAAAESTAQVVAAQYQGSPGDRVALSHLLGQVVASSPGLKAVRVYAPGGPAARLVASSRASDPAETAPPGGGAAWTPARGGGWEYRALFRGPNPAEVEVQTAPRLGGQVSGDLALNLLLVTLMELAVILVGIRLWSRWLVGGRLDRLTWVARQVADGAVEVSVAGAERPESGDELSRLAYELGRMVRTVGSRADRQAALELLTEDAAKGLAVGELHTRVARILAAGLGADVAGVYEMFAPSGALILRAAHGQFEPRQQLTLVGPQPFCARVLATGEPLTADSRAAASLGLEGRAARFAAIAVPGRQSPYGMLLVGSASEEGFAHEQLDFLQAVSHTVATAVNALHDPLTGLPNRLLFEDRVAQAVGEAARAGDSVGLHYIDLDNFKEVNDTLGHDAGDELLRHVADRLRKVLRASDLLARLGGDEFGLVQTIGPSRDPRWPVTRTSRDGDEAVAVQTATRLLDALAPPFTLAGSQVHVNASIGIAMHPEHGADAAALSRNADRAMYEAKLADKGTYRVFTPAMHSTAQRRLTLESGLRSALERDELQVHFQPQVDVSKPGTIVGFEALLRWDAPERGSVAPGVFVPIAEQTGLIVPIGIWVLRQACQVASEWQRRGLPPVRMAVNVAMAQFMRPEFPASVREVLDETGLDPALLQLELTEGSVTRHVDEVTERLHQLHALGVTVAMDDFGTGHSSLAYLNRLPFDALKIDRSFVSSIRDADGGDEGVLVSAIVNLGRSLRKTVVAEGIETAEQLAFLQSAGCEIGQGHLFAAAMSAEQGARALAASSGKRSARGGDALAAALPLHRGRAAGGPTRRRPAPKGRTSASS